jgi:hypothetical protein
MRALLTIALATLCTSSYACAEQLTKTVTYQGTKMDLIYSDTDNNVEIRYQETGAIMLRGEWNREDDLFFGNTTGECPYAVRGTFDYTGAFILFGQQPTCNDSPAQWKVLRFIGPPVEIQTGITRPVAKRVQRKHREHKALVARRQRPTQRPSTYSWGAPNWQWQSQAR